MADEETFDADGRRRIEQVMITKIHDKAVIVDSGRTFGGVPEEHFSELHLGELYLVETVQGSMVVGWAAADGSQEDGRRWLWRKSDQQLEAEHKTMVEGFERQHREMLEANREDWTRREAALPDWARARLESFRAEAGEKFDIDGWGYELVVSELSVMYVESNLAESEVVTFFARAEGTSGNQHDYAKALARARIEDPEFNSAGTVSALSPLTGSAGYA